MLERHSSTNPPAVIPIDFHGQQLESWRDERTEKVYVAMRRLCDNIGLNWSGQYAKLRQSHLFKDATGVMVIQTPGGQQEVIGLNLDLLPAWLLDIHPTKVAPAIRARLERYQQECVQALRNYWFTGVATRPVATDVTDPLLQAMLLTQQQISGLIGTTQEALNIAHRADAKADIALKSLRRSTVRAYLRRYDLVEQIPSRVARLFDGYLTRYCQAAGLPIYTGRGRERQFLEEIIHHLLPLWLARRGAQLDNF